jgi:hypothetical protein
MFLYETAEDAQVSPLGGPAFCKPRLSPKLTNTGSLNEMTEYKFGFPESKAFEDVTFDKHFQYKQKQVGSRTARLPNQERFRETER